MKLSSLIGQTLDDKYLIDKQLGKGGMGAVYLATHIGTGRPVAVKVITPQFMANDEFVERFKREAKAAGRLRHPNVVDVTDFGFAQVGRDRVAYLVMEYLDGCSLGDILAEESRLPLEWVVDILEQACSAVDEAHRQGIVHRDLKPDNIWLEPNRRGGYTVKVLDFGLAKLGDRVTAELPPVEASAATSEDQTQTAELQASPQLTTMTTQTLERSRDTQVLEGETQAYPPDYAADSEDSRRTQVMNPRDDRRNEAARTQLIVEGNGEGNGEAQGEGNGEQGRENVRDELRTQVMSGDEGAVTQVQMPQTTGGAVTRLHVPASQPNFEDADEAQTLIQPLDEAMTRVQVHDEGQTRIQLSEEEQTQILDPRTLEEDRTQILTEPPTFSSQTSASHDSSDGLTRVGSVLGTPLYMSPEQCNSLPLDYRTDIYSLGVIAYQMLTGATPFAGDISAVMRQHCDDPPPPFREVKARVKKRKRKFKIPKRVEAVVMQALAKRREDRPQSAAAFASMLRANSEGASALLRRSVALYSEYFPKFFLASLLVSLPNILLEGLLTLNAVLLKNQVITGSAALGFVMVFALLKMIFTSVAASILSGVTVRLVTQLMLAPLRPIRLRDAFAAVRRKLRPVLVTTAMVTFLTLLGMALCFIPGLWLMINYTLTMPVVMMENLAGRAAMRRSKALAKRWKRTVAFIVCVQLGLPLVISGVFGFLVGRFMDAPAGTRVRVGIDNLAPRIAEILRLPFDILLIPLLGIMTALLYLKMRQAGGEDLNQTLAEFEDRDAPKTKWQARMRDRLTISTPSK